MCHCILLIAYRQQLHLSRQNRANKEQRTMHSTHIGRLHIAIQSMTALFCAVFLLASPVMGADNYDDITTPLYGSNTNYGSITTTADLASAMQSDGFDQTLINAAGGTITTYGNGAVGMVVSNGSTATNSGTIATYGLGDAYGIQTSTGCTATNSGTIISYNTSAIRCYSGSTFYNSGTLASYGSHAIYADDSDVHLQTGTSILAGDVHGTGTSDLYLDGSGTVNFDISGDWTIWKTGDGTWTIAQNISAAAPAYVITGGTLALASGVSLSANNFFMDPGTTLQVALDGSGTTAIASFGASIIDGSNLVVDISANLIGNSQTILSAPTILGTFASVTSLNPHFSFDLDTTPTDVGITNVSYAPQWDNSALGMASSMESNMAFMLIPNARSQMLLSDSGEQQGQTMVASAGPLLNILPSSSGDRRYGVYMQPMFSTSTRDAYDSAPGYTANMAGGEVGVDAFVDDNLLLGAFAGFASTKIDFDGVTFAEGDTEDQQLYVLGIYGGYRAGDWDLTDTLSVTHIRHDSERNAGLGETAKGDYDSQLATNQFLASYNWLDNGDWRLCPELGLNTSYLYRSGFSETDATNAITFGKYSTFIAESVVGMRVSTDFDIRETQMTPYARLKWSHALNDNDVTVRQTLGSTTAQVTQSNDDDHLGLDLGLTARNGDASFSLTYAGEISQHGQSHGLSALMRYEF